MCATTFGKPVEILLVEDFWLTIVSLPPRRK